MTNKAKRTSLGSLKGEMKTRVRRGGLVLRGSGDKMKAGKKKGEDRQRMYM
jgi:hypothetical protein